MTPPPRSRRPGFTAEPAATALDATGAISEPVSLELSFSSRPSDMAAAATLVDVLDVLDAMMAPPPARLSMRKVKWNGMKAAAATGFAVVDWLREAGFAASRSAAAELARQLVRAGGLVPTFRVQASNQAFSTSPTQTYVHRGLTCLGERGLNAALVYPGKPRAVLEVLLDLNHAFARVLHVAVTVDGHFVDYPAIRGSVGWRETLVLLSELAVCDDSDIGQVHPDVKKACFFNLYNILIFHAKLVFSHPTDLVKRGKFFNDAAYVIAGKRITSVELEHDILRSRMDEKDARAAWKLEEKDPRMHFILNCGAQSCPPLVPLDAEHSEQMVQEATERFIENNCEIDIRNKKVTLSRLWKWFRNDFTPGSIQDNDLLGWICQHASKGKRAELMQLMEVDYKIKFAVYNWADNGDGNAKPDIRFMAIYDLSFAKTA